MVPDSQSPPWLMYSNIDSDLAQFIGGDYIVTDAFSHRSVGEPSSSTWEMEEWSVRSVLVPAERLEDAQRVLTFHDLGIEPQWIDRQRFDFGDAADLKGIPAKPWSFMREHRTTGVHYVEIQRDFSTYH